MERVVPFSKKEEVADIRMSVEPSKPALSSEINSDFIQLLLVIGVVSNCCVSPLDRELGKGPEGWSHVIPSTVVGTLTTTCFAMMMFSP